MDGRQIKLPSGKDAFQRMINALGKDDPPLNAFAEELVYRAAQVVDPAKMAYDLLLEAAANNRRAEHRIRILNLVLRIGAPLNADACMAVIYLCSHRDERVARKAGEVFMRLPTPMNPYWWDPKQGRLRSRPSNIAISVSRGTSNDP